MVTITTPGIVWDLDGTILDSMKLQFEILQTVLQARQLTMPSREVMAKNFHGKLDDTFRAIMPDFDESLLNTVLAEFLQLQNPYYDDLGPHLHADAVSLFQRAHAKGVVQVVVSNRSHQDRGQASPRSIMSRPPFNGLVQYVVSGDDNPYHKPDRRVMDAVLRATRLGPAEFTVVGDQFVDAELARNLGAQAVLVNRDMADIPHLERLGDGWQDYVDIVPTLNEVAVR